MDRVCALLGDEQDTFVIVAGPRASGDRRVVISQGEVWWADLRAPSGSGPASGGRSSSCRAMPSIEAVSRRSVCLPLTSNLGWADAPGNVLLTAKTAGLPKDSVANVSQVVTLDRVVLTERVGKLSQTKLELVLSGIDVVLGR